MRLLLDECVPLRLRRYILGHECSSVVQEGWSGVKNGKLLALAQSSFDVFLTVDSNLQHQQHIASFDICVMVVKTPSNALNVLAAYAPQIVAAMGQVQPGTVVTIDQR
jgi:hypothetical protein